MPRKRADEHPDDLGVDLAPAVTADQWRALRELGYTGPAPVSGPQAEAILRQWRRSRAPSTEPAAPPG
jgi:hypothetical protein